VRKHLFAYQAFHHKKNGCVLGSKCTKDLNKQSDFVVKAQGKEGKGNKNSGYNHYFL
jgi:hypothetical protein